MSTPISTPAASERVAAVAAQAARLASSLALARTQVGLTRLRSRTLPAASTTSPQPLATQPIWARWCRKAPNGPLTVAILADAALTPPAPASQADSRARTGNAPCHALLAQ